MKVRSLVWAGVLAVAVSHGAMAQEPDAEPETSAPPSAAQLRLERLLLEQQVAEAEQAIRTAEASTIPSSGVEGTVEAGDGAGEAEVLALAARQFSDGAAQIIRANPDPGYNGLFIAAGPDLPDISSYQLFVLRQEALAARLDEAGQSAEALIGVGAASPGTAIAIGSAVLSYFRSDFSLAKVAVEGLDDAAMVAAVVGLANGRVRPLDQGMIGTTVLDEVRSRLDALEVKRQRLELARRTCLTKPAELEADLEEASDDDKPAIERELIETNDSCVTITAAVDAYAAFVEDYTSAGGAELLKVFQQAELKSRMTAADVLLVKVHGVVGARYTQQNLISHLGGMPFHVTAASVVSWQRVAPDGRVVVAGWQPLYFGYRRLGEIDTLINGCSGQPGRRRSPNCAPPPVALFAPAPPTPPADRQGTVIGEASPEPAGGGGEA